MRRLILLLTACLAACTQEPPFYDDLPGDEASLRRYLEAGRLQEAEWESVKLGRHGTADSIRAALRAVLSADPVKVERWQGKGIMTNYLLTFPGGIRGFFKVAGSDTSGPVVNEVAAYEIDRLLRIRMTPLTLMREVTLPDGERVRGAIKTFVENARTAEKLSLKSEQKPDRLLFFDTVIANADRHLGNWMVRDDTKELFAIDHNRTFRFDLDWTWFQRMRTIRSPGTLGEPLERYRALEARAFREALSPHLTDEQIDRFLDSRLIILRYLDVDGAGRTDASASERQAA